MSSKMMVVKTLVVLFGLWMLSAPTALAQTGPCIGDLNCDGEVSGLDTIIYKADYPRSEYLNEPCPDYNPRCIPAGIPKTGQTTCYDESGNPVLCHFVIPGEGQPFIGQDGGQQKGVEWPNPRFTDNEDETVTDNLTGLIWLKDANCIATNYPGFDNDETVGDGRVTWHHALDFVAGINDGTYPDCGAGKIDWRLPNRFELDSLLDLEYTNPALPNTLGTGQWVEGDPFTNHVPTFYWSSTTVADNTSYAWFVDFYAGFWHGNGKESGSYVWPVRAGH